MEHNRMIIIQLLSSLLLPEVLPFLSAAADLTLVHYFNSLKKLLTFIRTPQHSLVFFTFCLVCYSFLYPRFKLKATLSKLLFSMFTSVY